MAPYTKTPQPKKTESKHSFAYDSNIARARRGPPLRCSKVTCPPANPTDVQHTAEDPPIALPVPGFRTPGEYDGMPYIECDGRKGTLHVIAVDGVDRIFLRAHGHMLHSAWPRLCDEVFATDAFEGCVRYHQAATHHTASRSMSPHMRGLAVPAFGLPIQCAVNWNGSQYTAADGTNGILRVAATGDRTFAQCDGRRVTWADEIPASEALDGLRRAEAKRRSLCQVLELTEAETGGNALLKMTNGTVVTI